MRRLILALLLAGCGAPPIYANRYEPLTPERRAQIIKNSQGAENIPDSYIESLRPKRNTALCNVVDMGDGNATVTCD